MWYRALCTTIVLTCTLLCVTRAQGSNLTAQIKDMVCVLLLSGVNKEELDESTLEKLQRHGVNIYDTNNENLRQDCLRKSSLQTKHIENRYEKAQSTKKYLHKVSSGAERTLIDQSTNILEDLLREISYSDQIESELQSDLTTTNRVIERRIRSTKQPTDTLKLKNVNMTDLIRILSFSDKLIKDKLKPVLVATTTEHVTEGNKIPVATLDLKDISIRDFIRVMSLSDKLEKDTLKPAVDNTTELATVDLQPFTEHPINTLDLTNMNIIDLIRAISVSDNSSQNKLKHVIGRTSTISEGSHRKNNVVQTTTNVSTNEKSHAVSKNRILFENNLRNITTKEHFEQKENKEHPNIPPPHDTKYTTIPSNDMKVVKFISHPSTHNILSDRNKQNEVHDFFTDLVRSMQYIANVIYEKGNSTLVKSDTPIKLIRNKTNVDQCEKHLSPPQSNKTQYVDNKYEFTAHPENMINKIAYLTLRRRTLDELKKELTATNTAGWAQTETTTPYRVTTKLTTTTIKNHPATAKRPYVSNRVIQKLQELIEEFKVIGESNRTNNNLMSKAAQRKMSNDLHNTRIDPNAEIIYEHNGVAIKVQTNSVEIAPLLIPMQLTIQRPIPTIKPYLNVKYKNEIKAMKQLKETELYMPIARKGRPIEEKELGLQSLKQTQIAENNKNVYKSNKHPYWASDVQEAQEFHEPDKELTYAENIRKTSLKHQSPIHRKKNHQSNKKPSYIDKKPTVNHDYNENVMLRRDSRTNIYSNSLLGNVYIPDRINKSYLKQSDPNPNKDFLYSESNQQSIERDVTGIWRPIKSPYSVKASSYENSNSAKPEHRNKYSANTKNMEDDIDEPTRAFRNEKIRSLINNENFKQYIKTQQEFNNILQNILNNNKRTPKNKDRDE